MFTGLTFFGIPITWFLRLAEAVVMGGVVLLLVTIVRYQWRRNRETPEVGCQGANDSGRQE